MAQPGIATHLVGMNNREILRSNLDILNNGLSDLEKRVLQEISTQYVVIIITHTSLYSVNLICILFNDTVSTTQVMQ
jgi:predicted aldo/keto reductase-like oxidoreductase